MIDRDTINRIIDTAQILDVVSDFVRLKKKGQNYWGLCPFHSDRSPSFSVSPSRNICKCFACGEGGSPLNFIMKHEHLEYVDALKWLAKKYNIEIVDRELTEKEKEISNHRQSLMIINSFAGDFFSSQLKSTDEGRIVGLSYLQKRGINSDMIEKFSLGYSPSDRNALQMKARELGYDIEKLTELGLLIKYDNHGNDVFVDRFRDRVIFPIHNIGGRIVGFGGRIMINNDKTGKYVNSPESMVYNKSRELYGLYQAKTSVARLDKIYFVEGYLDVISLFQNGITNVVAGSGTAMTDQQINLVRRFTQNITLVYDGDKAGIKAAFRSLDLLLRQNMNVSIVTLPEGEDPDSFAQKNTTDYLKRYLDENEVDFISFKTSILKEEMDRDPLSKSKVISNILSSISLIPDNITKSVYIKSLSSQIDIEENVLLSELNKLQQTSVTAYSTNFDAEHVEDASQKKETENSGDRAFKMPAYEQELIKLIIAKGDTVIRLDEEQSEDRDIHYFSFIDEVVNIIESECVLPELSDFLLSVIDEIRDVVVSNSLRSYTHFLNHENFELRELANTINVDSYTIPEYLSLTEKVMEIKDRIRKEVKAIKMQIILDRIDQTKKMLYDADVLSDENKLEETIDSLNYLNKLKSELAAQLGERSILG